MTEKDIKARTSITIDKELLQRVKDESFARDQSVSQYISSALKKYLNNGSTQ